MDKHLPVVIFALCVAIALILAWTLPSSWPAALAIAIAGAALAITMRVPTADGEIAYLIDDIATLRRANTELRSELANAHSMIDELADVVEQIATVTADGQQGAPREEVESLRAEFSTLRADMAPDATIPDRLDAIEARLASVAATSAAMVQPTPEPNGDSERLRTLIARGNGQSEPAPDVAPARPGATVSLTPVFKPELGGPVAFVFGTSMPESIDAVPGLFHHAAQIAEELESASRDVRLFVRLSGSNLAHLSVRRDILAHVDASEALRKRLVLMTPQQGFDDAAQNTLSAVAERGCKFALDDVRDWSINLAALSRAGLGWIVVDGVAMAESAQEQGGDPRRLAQALGANGIELIADGVMIREDIETVSALEPVLMMGDGLGIPRSLDETV